MAGIKMIYTIDEIMAMLDWNKPKDVQRKGRELAKDVKCFQVFLRPGYPQYNKNVWDNCALIVADRTDEELRPYLSELFEWLEDMNWPGAFCIWERLKQYEDKEWFNSMLKSSLYKAKVLKRRMWLDNLREFQGEDSICQSESDTMNEAFARRVYDNFVEESTNTSRILYDDAILFEGMPEFQKKKIELYQSLDESQKDVFMTIFKTVRSETIERLFSMLEGLGRVRDRQDFEIELKINGVGTNDELTDTFCRVVKERLICRKK